MNLPHPINWCIASDYCFGNKDKLDVATFTIFPTVCGETLSETIKENLPKDIKDTQQFSQKNIDFIKETKLFFNISVIVNDLNYFFDPELAKKQISQSIQTYKSLSQDKKIKKVENGSAS